MIDIVPGNDIKEHIDGSLCLCNPTVENSPEYNEPIVIHNAFDKREFWEQILFNTVGYKNKTERKENN
jgi:hypothetical protein